MPFNSSYKKRLHQRKWQRDRRKKAIELLGGQCFECCNTNRKLEFHHRDPEVKVDRVQWSWSWKRILEEVAKCDLLCRKCHAKHTIEQAKQQVSQMQRTECGKFMTAEQAAA